jgi:L-rhamnose-H+ transport protein
LHLGWVRIYYVSLAPKSADPSEARFDFRREVHPIMSSVSLGILLSVVAGILNGSFATPTKYVKKWKWENIWAVWGVVGMVLFPWFLVWVTVPGAAHFYAQAPARPILYLIIFGLGFGLAQIFFGLGIAAIGLSLNFAIAIGLSTALGSLVPLIALHPEAIPTLKGKMIFLGVGFMLAGIVLSAIAGREKERELQPSLDLPEEGAERRMSFKAGLFICILAGLGSPLINFGLAFGTPLIAQAAQAGVSPATRANVIWAPLVSASFIPYILYCTHLWRKNRSFHLYRESGTWMYFLFGAVMGVLWMGSTAIYGAVSAKLESMGPILGWPLFMASIILTSNAWGFATGEWKGTARKPRAFIFSGIGLLILGFVALAYASHLA